MYLGFGFLLENSNMPMVNNIDSYRRHVVEEYTDMLSQVTVDVTSLSWTKVK